MIDNPHHYEITLHKGELLIELSSDDVYFISKQMDKWCRSLMDHQYIPPGLGEGSSAVSSAPAVETVPEPAEPAVPEVTPEATSEPTPEPPAEPPPPEPDVEALMDAAVAEPEAEPEPAPEPEPTPVVEEPTPEPPAAEPEVTLPEVEDPTPEAAPEPPPPPSTPEQEVAAAEPQPAASEPTSNATGDQPTDDDFEAVLDSLMADLNEEEDTAPPEAAATATDTVHGDSPVIPPVVMPGDTPVDQVLKEASSGPALSPPVAFHTDEMGNPAGLIESFNDLCAKADTNNPEAMLMLASYYLKYFEASERFSLKHINSLMVRSGLTPVNHGSLESALSKGYLTLLPDLTGMAEVTEYTLSPEGQEYCEKML